MTEEWRPVPFQPFNERYEVSDRGRVKNIETGKLLNGWPHSHTQTPKMTLNMRGKHRDFYTKELVWAAFGGRVVRASYLRNKDGDAKNVNFDNLFVQGITYDSFQKTMVVASGKAWAERRHVRTVDEFWDQFFAEHAPTCYQIWQQKENRS